MERYEDRIAESESDTTRRPLNMDELIAQMERDEAEDAKLITPVDYAKIRPFSPQQIYYHIRRGHIKSLRCACGRNVIEKAAADEYFVSVGKLQPRLEDEDD
jgi:hypothetical protein